MSALSLAWLSGRRADAVLAALVVATVGMMIVPLPTPLLDVCIALNLTLGVLLLAAALYLRDALQFAAFPTLLLLSTLYRLSLNVSSTRLILLQADAGRVIHAFGSFVVRGDYIVGALVFVVLTLVQFIVIARGAERVAEVGARFSLDALPGKQLAIDADLRSGQLSPDGARKERRKLERESQLYGAMDGAMKFVKGDAIAGVVITLVNVLGGVTLGVTARGLDVADSLKRYGLLTIGDGIVTQIPALLGATAAGLLVTRVADAEGEGSLGRDLAEQLFGDARVVGVGALLLLVLGLIPEMPTFPFLLASGGCALLTARALRRGPKSPARSTAQAGPTLELLVVELSPDLAQTLLTRDKPGATLSLAVERAERELTHELGISLPSAEFRARRELPTRSFQLAFRELREPVTRLPDGSDAVEALEAALRVLIRRRAADCLDLEEVEHLLAALERQKPALVRLTVPRMLSLPLLARVLQELVREGVSVRWLAEILEHVAPLAEQGKSLHELVEAARRALAPRISQALAPEGSLPVLRLSPLLEETLSDALKHDGDRVRLALPAALADEVVDEVVRTARQNGPVRAVLTQAVLRRHVRTLLQDSAPELPVICPEELLPSTQLVPKATVGP